MPFCTMLLADLGAHVIKVESRDRGRERVSLGVERVRDGAEERVPVAQYRERDKLGITLELKTPKGVELFKELVARADVVTENFSVGTMERLGLGYDDLRAINPAIVYASVTAFGQDGPYARMLCAFSIVGERYTVGGEILTRGQSVGAIKGLVDGTSALGTAADRGVRASDAPASRRMTLAATCAERCGERPLRANASQRTAPARRSAEFEEFACRPYPGHRRARSRATLWS